MNRPWDYPVYEFDVEIFPNFSMVGFRDHSNGARREFSSEAGMGESFDALRAFWPTIKRDALIIGFNSIAYDNLILKGMLLGEDTDELYRLSQRIINSKRSRCEAVDGEIGLDVFAMIGGTKSRVSLKELGIKLDYPHLQELPYPFDQPLTVEQMQEVMAYNRKDLDITAMAVDLVREVIDARLAISIEIGVYLQSMHDAKLAEAVMAKKLFGSFKPTWPNARSWMVSGQTIAHGFTYHNPEINALVERLRQQVFRWQLLETCKADGDTEKTIEGSTYADEVKVGDVTYRLGQGGIHSQDGPALFEADEQWCIIDFDGSSYYPTLILRHQLCPAHLPAKAFLKHYGDLRQRRLDAKAMSLSALAAGLKIAINAVFGKTKSPYSWLLDPVTQIMTTLRGQLTLLTFIDALDGIDGCEIITANTDGWTMRIRRTILADVIAGLDQMAAGLNFTLDRVEYQKVARRDISNYVAITPSGKIKGKGAYGRDAGDLTKKAVNRIVVTAAQQFFAAGTPVADTVRACRNIGEFVDYFKCSRDYTMVDDQGAAWGGIARWYIGVNGHRLDKVRIADGKKFKQVDHGAMLINRLPDSFPADVDVDHYIAMAEKLVADITEPELRISHTIPIAELSQRQHAQQKINLDIRSVDIARVTDLDLHREHDDLAAVFKGNRYDSFKSCLVRVWLRGCGRLTVGDLIWVGKELDAAGGYFAGSDDRKLTGLVEWIARTISPWPLPRSTEEQVARAMTWAVEHVEPLKRQKKHLTTLHRGVLRSPFINSTALRKFDKTRNDYALACAICAVMVKHTPVGETPDAALALKIVSEVHEYFEARELNGEIIRRPDDTLSDSLPEIPETDGNLAGGTLLSGK